MHNGVPEGMWNFLSTTFDNISPEKAQGLKKQPNKRYPTGFRNKAIISLMLRCRLRVSEVVSLRSGGINLTNSNLRVEAEKEKKIESLLYQILRHTDISATTIYIPLANIDIENGMKSFK